MALKKWNEVRRPHEPSGEARIKRMKEEIMRGTFGDPCQACLYRKEHQGACANCGRPKPRRKRIL